MNFYKKALGLFPYTQSVRRDIHQHPEIQHEEIRTAKIVSDTLQSLGMPVKTNIASTGVLGLLEGNGDGPTLMIRADMDALSMQETNDVPYASKNDGKMHACGHDGHVAMLLTTAKLLTEERNSFPGRVLFLFQPAEEGGFGAQRMLDAGALEWVKPDYSLGLHLWNEMPVGTMVVRGGPVMAGALMFEINVKGKGGHGAVPQLAIDPVLAASQITVALQSIVARNISPLDAAVISVCMIQTGTASNIIPDTTLLKGTIRAFTPEIFETLSNRLVEVTEGVAEAMGCKAEVLLGNPISPTTNNDEIAHLTKEAILEVLPETTINENHQTMGSEDMSIWLDKVPGCFFFLGSANSEKGLNYSHHHPKFDFDENALPMGAASLASAAVKILSSK